MEKNADYRLVDKKFPQLCLYARMALYKLSRLIFQITPDDELRTYSMFIAHSAVLRCLYNNKEELMKCRNTLQRDSMISHFVFEEVDYRFIEAEVQDQLKLMIEGSKMLCRYK